MTLTADQLTALGRLDTPAVADAIETFQVRLRNVGFADGTLRCCFEDMPPVVGYAVTARIRTAIPPMVGSEYGDRLDWWTSVRDAPRPQIVVIEDADAQAGFGALVGEVQGTVLRALGVVGLVTSGAVRSLPALQAAGLQVFARRVVPSHAYAHVFEYNVPVRVGGLEIKPGDLLHADRNGLLTVPHDVAPHVASAAARLRAHNDAILKVCHEDPFALEHLRDLLKSRDGLTTNLQGASDE
jgi:regulator of RNase E activity RraA